MAQDMHWELTGSGRQRLDYLASIDGRYTGRIRECDAADHWTWEAWLSDGTALNGSATSPGEATAWIKFWAGLSDEPSPLI